MRTESKQSKEGRHPLSLSPPHTDHRRIARSPCQNATESPIIFIPVEGPFFQVNLSDGPSRSLSHSLSVPSISLSLYVEVFSKDELQLSHQSVMGGQPVSRRGHEKLLFFSTVNNRTIGKCLSVFHDRVESAVSKRVRFPSVTHSCSSKIIAWG